MTTYRPRLTYAGTPEQKERLIEALKVLQKSGVSYDRLKNECADWWNNSVRPEFNDVSDSRDWSVSKGTLSNLRNGNVPNMETASILYAFLSGPWGTARPITDAGLGGVLYNEDDELADIILRRFGHNQPISYESLVGLTTLRDGSPSWWEAYRPSWQTLGAGYVIRSHIRIERRNASFWLREEQRFTFEGRSLVQIDQGLIFPFALALACLSTSGDDEVEFNGNCMKVYSFTQRVPSPNKRQETSTIRGTVMAVSNQGPHWSGPISLMRREKDELRELCHRPLPEFRDEGDANIDGALDYLISNENTSHLSGSR